MCGSPTDNRSCIHTSRSTLNSSSTLGPSLCSSRDARRSTWHPRRQPPGQLGGTWRQGGHKSSNAHLRRPHLLLPLHRPTFAKCHPRLNSPQNDELPPPFRRIRRGIGQVPPRLHWRDRPRPSPQHPQPRASPAKIPPWPISKDSWTSAHVGSAFTPGYSWRTKENPRR